MQDGNINIHVGYLNRWFKKQKVTVLSLRGTTGWFSFVSSLFHKPTPHHCYICETCTTKIDLKLQQWLKGSSGKSIFNLWQFILADFFKPSSGVWRKEWRMKCLFWWNKTLNTKLIIDVAYLNRSILYESADGTHVPHEHFITQNTVFQWVVLLGQGRY